MKKYVLSLALFGSLFGTSELKYQEFYNFKSPESILLDKNYVYVSNVSEKLESLAKDKDNDEFVSKFDKNGKVFLTHFNVPKGMLEIGKTLYVVDIDVLRGFDLKIKKENFNLPIKGVIFLNDIEKLDNNTLLISYTGTGLILQVNLKTKQYSELLKLDLAKLGGLNELYLDRKKHKLFIAGYHLDGVNGGVVLSYDLKKKEFDIIKNEKESYDGIVSYKDGLLVKFLG